MYRRHGDRSAGKLLATGAEIFDAALGGGIPTAGLAEFHGAETRDAGALCGFVLGLIGLFVKAGASAAPVLWTGTADVFHEAGMPYAPGLDRRFGVAPGRLLIAQASKTADVLWIAEEAARLDAISVLVVELRGSPRELDLTATRRLHRRALAAGLPIFLLRHSGAPAPTAAPLRFRVGAASAALRKILGRPFPGSIGPPRFSVTLDKNRFAQHAHFILEWNADERVLPHVRPARSRPEDPVALVSLPSHGAHLAPTPGSVVAFEPARRAAASGGRPSAKQRAAHRKP